MVVITGVVYPLVVTAIGHVVFPHRSHGSLLVRGDTLVGSELIGQPFESPKYFWPRPSATSPVPYNAGASGGSNLGPTNPALQQAVQDRVARLKAADPNNSLHPRGPCHRLGQRPGGVHQSAAAQYQVPGSHGRRGPGPAVGPREPGAAVGFLGQPR
jgi:K+-transporting ATPase ATPase C chain